MVRNREYYACASHWHGAACANTINVARSVVQDVMLDGIRKDVGAFVAEATIIPRVEPGTVRAEVVFAR